MKIGVDSVPQRYYLSEKAVEKARRENRPVGLPFIEPGKIYLDNVNWGEDAEKGKCGGLGS